MRATDLVQATINKESAQQAAEAKLFSETKGADGTRYKQTQDAEAKLYADTKSAEGLLYKQRQDAEAACKSIDCVPFVGSMAFPPLVFTSYIPFI